MMIVRKGSPAIFTGYQGSLVGEEIAVASNAELDDALVYASGLTWVSTAAISGTVSATVGTAAVTGIGTSFLSEVAVNGWLVVGGNYWAIKSIETNENLTLWHGAQANATDAAASFYNPSKVSIVLAADVALTASRTMPNGVALQIVGRDNGKRLMTGAYSIVGLSHNYIDISWCRAVLQSGSNGLFYNTVAGVGGGARSIFRLHDIFADASQNQTGTFAALYGAAIDIHDLKANNLHVLSQSDYLNFIASTWNTSAFDVLLHDVHSSNTYDIAYDHNISVQAVKQAPYDSGSMFESNQWVAGKTTNIYDSKIIHVPLSDCTSPNNSGAIPIYPPDTGALNLNDSIIHVQDFPGSTFDWYEINREAPGRDGSTVNVTASTRGDGSALRTFV